MGKRGADSRKLLRRRMGTGNAVSHCAKIGTSRYFFSESPGTSAQYFTQAQVVK